MLNCSTKFNLAKNSEDSPIPASDLQISHEDDLHHFYKMALKNVISKESKSEFLKVVSEFLNKLEKAVLKRGSVLTAIKRGEDAIYTNWKFSGLAL